MITTELQDLSDQARKFAGSDSHAVILTALIKAKAIEEAGRAISEALDSVSGSLDLVARTMKGIR